MEDEFNQVTLDSLPEELIHHIISFLSYSDVLTLELTSKYLQSATSSIPTLCYRPWVLQLLNLANDDRNVLQVIDCLNDKETVDWRYALKETHLMFKKLADCKPPGCKYQKYLRWLEGYPTDSPIVRRVIVGVSMFPSTFREMVEETPENNDVIQFTKRSKTVLNWLFPDDSFEGPNESTTSSTPESPKQYFRFDRFQLLMEYVIEENKRLRLLMAEYCQIKIRSSFQGCGFSRWSATKDLLQEMDSTPFEELFYCKGRQMGAFLDLIKLNRQDQDIRFWA